MPLVSFSMRAVLAGCALLAAGTAQASVADDTVDPTHLIWAYHRAVVGHDGATLAQYFVPEGSAWYSVLSDKGLAQARATKPEAAKVRPGSVAGFVKMVSTSQSALDPEHSNLRITSDGDVGTVTFDFRFLIDGKEENRGAESWQIIRTPEGWRIVSIVYSSTPVAR